MPTLIRLRRGTSGPASSEFATRRGEVLLGLAGICGVLILLAAIGIVYAVGTTPEHTYSAEMAATGSIRTGDDVRVAGIPVGKVKSLSLLPDRVRMTFTVADRVFLGDRTALDIRMLTIVGGYYVAVEPAGTTPLGSTVIPESRVTLPYNLSQAFQDAIAPVQRVNGDTLRQNLADLGTAANTSPDAIRSAVQAVDDLAGIMDRQNSDISRTLSMADEYLAALDQNSAVLGQLLSTLRVLETIVQHDKAQIAQSLWDLATVLHDLSPLGRAWDDSIKQRVQPLADAIPQLDRLGTQLGTLLDSLRTLEQRLLPFVSTPGGVAVDQSAATVVPQAICVPVPGGGC